SSAVAATEAEDRALQQLQATMGRTAQSQQALSVNTANVAAQFQDIGVTALAGQNWMQIALQQGTQLSAVLGNQGVAGAASMVKGALLSVVSPVSLLTIGITGLTAVGLQW